MASFLNQLVPEPFEESQSRPSANALASPDALKAFYSEMERREMGQRKLSRGKTSNSSGGKSWFRKKPTTAGITTAPTPTANMDSIAHTEDGDEAQIVLAEDQKESYDQLSTMLTRSIIPDPLGELPAWFGKESEWPPSPVTPSRPRYPLHNPVGPRWYKNHHLIPPSQLRSTSRPPSVFSPSFPPMAPSIHESSEDATRPLGPSRTPSGSPLPTPNSSQTRLVDSNAKGRTRKNSQTAHDTVDLLDVSDPWGTNWHHQSPYDAGLVSSPVSVDSPEPPVNSRSRIPSMTAGRRKTVTPSPLSQSTSAIHLRSPELAQTNLPRKLSKRRKPVLGGLFGPKDSDDPPLGPTLAPVTPADLAGNYTASGLDFSRSRSQRRSSLALHSTIIPSNTPSALPTHTKGDKGEKRASVLGRLTKKFSLLRKPAHGARESINVDDWHHIEAVEANGRNPRDSSLIHRQSSPEKPALGSRTSTDPSKRVPPPVLEPESTTTLPPIINNNIPAHDTGDQDSSISVEPPFSVGKLTIANPDAPSSGYNSPIKSDMPLPSEAVAELAKEEAFEHSADPPPRPESALPPVPASAANTAIGPAIISHPQAPLADAAQVHLPEFHDERNLPATPQAIPESSRSLPASPALPAVPFPAAINTTSAATADSGRLPASICVSADESPLSRASILANPPTPYISPIPMTPNTSAAASIFEERRSARDTSPTKVPVDDSSKAEVDRIKTSSSSAVAIPSNSSTLGSIPITRRGERSSRDASPTKITTDSPVKDNNTRARSPVSGVAVPANISTSASMPVSREEKALARDASPTKVPADGQTGGESQRNKSSSSSAVAILSSMPTTNPALAVRDDTRTARDPSPRVDTGVAVVKVENSRIRSPSTVISRETETFRLVRSASGSVHNAGTTITAEGEQWEIVESEPPRRSKTRESTPKSKDRDSDSRDGGSRREQRRQEKARAHAESEQRRAKSQGRQKSVNGRVADHAATVGSSSSRATRARSLDVPHRADEERRMGSSPFSVDINKPQPPAPPSPTLGHPSLERRSSNSARPTSELPSTADLNAMKAQEAWDMERLWKGRSMYNGLPSNSNGTMTSPTTMEDVMVSSSKFGKAGTASSNVGHGSSHTAFLVQTPFQGQPSVSDPSNVVYYSQIGPHPPPVQYSSTPSLHQSFYPSSGSRDHSNVHQTHRTASYRSDPPASRSLANPLPEPPRESPYEPAPFPSMPNPNSGPESWTQYTNVTTAH